ncbi:MAG: type II toxin-antitoxin system VapC family toxin [Spirochaetota bacterium]
MNEGGRSHVLLDTHIWIWLLEGSPHLENAELLSIVNQAAHNGLLRVSAISMWEVGMLEAKGRIRFSISCLEWVRRALSVPGMRLEPLTPEIAVESSRLPGNFHGDPANRIIIATARHIQALLITRDERIKMYSAQGYIRTF